MAIHVVAGEDVDLSEDEIRKAFESNLTVLAKLGVGDIEYVDSEVRIGTGRIDTLAVDDENRPVFIEYKKRGEFDKEAIIQLMDYLSWFIKDKTHFSHLEKHIKKKKPTIEDIKHEIKLVCIVSDVEERVKNACYVIDNPVQIVTYSSIKDTDGGIKIIPRLELDNTEKKVKVEESIPESEILKEYSHLAPLYQEVKKEILSCGNDAEFYTRNWVVKFRRRKVFAEVVFLSRKREIALNLLIGQGAITDPRIPYSKSWPDWGAVHISKISEIDGSVKSWIKKAYENADVLVSYRETKSED